MQSAAGADEGHELAPSTSLLACPEVVVPLVVATLGPAWCLCHDMPLVPLPLGFKCRHLGGYSRSVRVSGQRSRSFWPMTALLLQHTTTRGGHLSWASFADTHSGPLYRVHSTWPVRQQFSRFTLASSSRPRRSTAGTEAPNHVNLLDDYRERGPTSGISPSSTPDASESLSRLYSQYEVC